MPLADIREDAETVDNGPDRRAEEAQEPRSDRPLLLVVEDDPATRDGLRALFGADFDVMSAEDGADARVLIRAHVPELVLADLTMPRVGGLELLAELRADPRTARVPFVFLSAQADASTVVRCLEQGAADFVAKPARPAELRARLRNALATARKLSSLESLARTDALTGLYNFRALQHRLEDEFKRATRYAEPLAIVMVDLDHLKRVNDTQGHEAGNEAITTLADVLRRTVREVDFVARFGGDEFVVILPHQTAREAAVFAERLRTEVGRRTRASPFPLSVSVGVAAHEPEASLDGPGPLLACADQALYRSKQLGRNRVQIHTLCADGSGSAQTH